MYTGLKLIKIFIILNMGFWILVPIGLESQTPEVNFSFINQSLKTSKYLILQGNSLLPIPNYLEKSSFVNSKGKTIMATVTGYTLSSWETDNDPCIVASGINACQEISKNIVACPRKYPFGTKVIINGKVYHCEDRTNIKYDGVFDILFKTRKEMNDWGKEILPVTILDLS